MRYGLHPGARHYPDLRNILMEQVFRTTGFLTIVILVLAVLYLGVRLLAP